MNLWKAISYKIFSRYSAKDAWLICRWRYSLSDLKSNWRQFFPFLLVCLFFFCPNTFLLGQRILDEQINDILCKTNFFTLSQRPFWKRSDLDHACDTSHMCEAVNSVISRLESNKLRSRCPAAAILRAKKKEFFFQFWCRPPFRDYVIRSEK